MSDFFLKVAIPSSHIPKKILRVMKEVPESGSSLYTYFYQEEEPLKVKCGPRKRDSYMQTPFWLILSSKPLEDYAKRKWLEDEGSK